jgi:hypothetical protein
MSDNVPALVNPQDSGLDFGSFRNPEITLKEAEMVAASFKRRADKMELYKQIGGSKHLLVEGWQMLAAMYRVTASITSTRYVQFGGVDGWEATAEAIHIPTGQRVSSADAMCLSDEDNWGPRPKYEWQEQGGRKVKVQVGTVATPTQQLRSMAQTRACSKVYSNLLKFVAKMAGFAATPAEEMTGNEPGIHENSAHQQGNGSSGPQRAASGPIISEPQGKRLFAMAKQSGKSEGQIKAILAHFGFETYKDVTKEKYEAVCAAVSNPQWAAPAGPKAESSAPPVDLWSEITKAFGGEDAALKALANRGFESWAQVNFGDRTGLAMQLIEQAKK